MLCADSFYDRRAFALGVTRRIRENPGKGGPRYRGGLECLCGKRHHVMAWGQGQMGPQASVVDTDGSVNTREK